MKNTSALRRIAVPFGMTLMVSLSPLGCADPLPAAPPPLEECCATEPTPEASRVLILDHEVRHPAYWADVWSGLEEAGLQPTYRRYYPHLTDADVGEAFTQDGLQWALIIIAAGGGPATPATQMRADEVGLASTYLASGGTLLLAPTASQEDTAYGENEWTLMNRIAEEAGVDMRIDRGLLFGTYFLGEPPPPHHITLTGYATSLEPVLGYAYAETYPGEWSDQPPTLLPAGRAPRLLVASPQVEVLAATRSPVYLWRHLGGDPDTRIEEHDTPQPVAAIASSPEGGALAIVPRSLLLMSGVNGELSDHSLPDPGRPAAVARITEELMAHLVNVAKGEDEVKVTVPFHNGEIFSVAAPGLEPLQPDVLPVRAANSRVNRRAIQSDPPEGEIEHRLAFGGQIGLPGWASASGGRLAYGGLPQDLSRMREALEEAQEHGVDVVMTSTSPERMVNGLFDEQGAASQEAMHQQIADSVADLDVKWFAGGYLSQMLADPGSALPLRGPSGQDGGFPNLLDEALWANGILPTFAKVGELAAAHPGLAGFHLDLELYGGPVQHRELWAFSDDEWQVFLRLTEGDDTVDFTALEAQNERLNALVDAGLLGRYLQELENEVAERTSQARQAARSQAPDLEFSLYLAGFPDSYFHRGLIRGLSEVQRPVTVMTYEVWTGRAQEAMAGDGYPFSHLGGTLLSYWHPTAFERVVIEETWGSDGYWFLGFNDISSSNDAPPALYGNAESYWSAIENGHAFVETEPRP